MFDPSQVMWNPVIWFLMSTILVGIIEIKGEALKAMDPEMYPKRRMSLLVYSVVIGTLNMSQVAARIELIPIFNYLITSFLFLRFYFIESGDKKKTARNMFFLTFALAILTLFD